MKTVYILLQHKPNGKTTRPGVWANRETAERHKRRYEKWDVMQNAHCRDRCSTFEIVEEERP